MKVSVVTSGPDGKILIGGIFSTVNNTARGKIARLNANGSLDMSFDPGGGANDWVCAIAVQTDGKIIVGGIFSSYDNAPHHYIVRLNDTGAVDSGFDPISDSTIFFLAVTPTSKIIIGGYFSNINGIWAPNIAQLNPDGTLDTNFAVGRGPTDGYSVHAIKQQRDGKILIGGGFRKVDRSESMFLARLNPDGSRDPNYISPLEGDWYGPPVRCIALQRDGKAIVGGYFLGRIARLEENGDRDPNFAPNVSTTRTTSTVINAIKIQNDERILIGGEFSSINGTNRNRIARLNSDGSLDSSFSSETGANGMVRCIDVQSNGKVIIAGEFWMVSESTQSRIARLHPNGSLDETFLTYVPSSIHALAIQPDDKILIGGNFTSVDDVTRNYIARLNPDGTVDSSFNPQQGPDGGVRTITLQPDGRILIGGEFFTINGVRRRHIARLNADGSLDLNFDPGSGATSTIYSSCLQADGKSLIGGSFTAINGVWQNFVARLMGDPPSLHLTASGTNNLELQVAGFGTNSYTIDSSDNLIVWNPLAQISLTGGLAKVVLGKTNNHQFYRVKNP